MHEEASQQAQVSTEMTREHQCLVRNRALQGTLTIEGGRPAVTSHYSLPYALTILDPRKDACTQIANYTQPCDDNSLLPPSVPCRSTSRTA